MQYREKYRNLMEGRCGFDKLNRDLVVLWIIIGFLNSLFRSRTVTLISLLLPLFAGLRMFSTSLYKRSNENRKYLKYKDNVTGFCKIQYLRMKEAKTHKYYKCKNCRSYIRVKRKKGEHYIDCPKCGKEFKVKIK